MQTRFCFRTVNTLGGLDVSPLPEPGVDITDIYTHSTQVHATLSIRLHVDACISRGFSAFCVIILHSTIMLSLLTCVGRSLRVAMQRLRLDIRIRTA